MLRKRVTWSSARLDVANRKPSSSDQPCHWLHFKRGPTALIFKLIWTVEFRTRSLGRVCRVVDSLSFSPVVGSENRRYVLRVRGI